MIELSELSRIQRAAVVALQPLATARPVEVMTLLRPQEADYDRVFVGKAIEHARYGYAQMWMSPPGPLGKRGQTEVHAFAAITDVFRTENEFSQQFPGGYRKIAEHLNS